MVKLAQIRVSPLFVIPCSRLDRQAYRIADNRNDMQDQRIAAFDATFQRPEAFQRISFFQRMESIRFSILQ